MSGDAIIPANEAPYLIQCRRYDGGGFGWVCGSGGSGSGVGGTGGGDVPGAGGVGSGAGAAGAGVGDSGAGIAGSLDGEAGAAGFGASDGEADPVGAAVESEAAPCTAASAGEVVGPGSLGLTAVPASEGVAGRLPPIGVMRNALILPTSLTTNTMLPTTTGKLLMRTFPVDARAASAPVALSSQCM
jgi:hypothetical protein